MHQKKRLSTGQYLFVFILLVSLTFYLPDTISMGKEKEADNTEDYQTNLNGEWLFFSEQLIPPNETIDIAEARKVILPSSFEEQNGKINSFGTYYRKITIPDAFVHKPMAIHIPYEYSAYTFFVDGLEIAQNGKVGTNAHTHETEMAPRTGYFFPQANEIELVIHVSSFRHIRGGLENEMFIGDAASISANFTNEVNWNLFMVSALFIMGIFTLSFVFFRKEQRELMVFGLFCLLVGSRAFFTDPFYYTLVFPKINWLWGTRLEYILSLLCSWVFVLLMYSWYHKTFSKKVVIALSAFLLPTAMITLFTQPVFFQSLFFKVALLAIPTGIYFVFLTIKELKDNNSKAKINTLGLILILIAFMNDFAQGINLYRFIPLMLPATGLYVLLHMVQMSIDFAKMTWNQEKLNKELIALNASLDEEVYARTIELEKANLLLREQAMLDGLTGILNRRSFDELLLERFQEAKNNATPLAVLMIDVDQFKKYNDYYGHLKGDWLLREMVQVIEEQLPKKSFFARYGGEEFALILPNTSKERAYEIAQQIRRKVDAENYEHPQGVSKHVTISIGVAVYVTEKDFQSELDLVQKADERLYMAKEAGRNRVEYMKYKNPPRMRRTILFLEDYLW